MLRRTSMFTYAKAFFCGWYACEIAFLCLKCSLSMGNHGGRNPHVVSREKAEKAEELNLVVKLRRVFLVGSHLFNMERCQIAAIERLAGPATDRIKTISLTVL